MNYWQGIQLDKREYQHQPVIFLDLKKKNYDMIKQRINQCIWSSSGPMLLGCKDAGQSHRDTAIPIICPFLLHHWNPTSVHQQPGNPYPLLLNSKSNKAPTEKHPIINKLMNLRSCPALVTACRGLRENYCQNNEQNHDLQLDHNEQLHFLICLDCCLAHCH